MTFYIPPWDRPAEFEVYKDPTTGAKIRRLKRRKTEMQTPDSNSYGQPLPATCKLRNCAYTCQPHDRCVAMDFFAPQKARWHSSYRPPLAFPAANPNTYLSTDEAAFRTWLISQPGNHLPREMPSNWNPPMPLPGGWTDAPWRPGHRASRSDPVIPGVTTPRHQRSRSEPVIPGVTTPMPQANLELGGVSQEHLLDGLPNRIPDELTWNNVNGGRLTWSPSPWVAHPLPHPSMSPQRFWQSVSGPWQHWRGPGGWTPSQAHLDLARMYTITGGHPLPGQDPYWTPMNWSPPLHSLSNGMTLISQWLAPSPRNASVPHILWDASVEHPDQIRRMTSRGLIVPFASTDYWKTAATIPDATSIKIHIPHMNNTWGPLEINKKTPVEVRDVFEAAWKYLQTPITWDDVAALLRTPDGAARWRKIHYACYRRCHASSALPEYERREGVKRVDFLEGHTIFWGIWPCYSPDGTLYFCMGFLPKNLLY